MVEFSNDRVPQNLFFLRTFVLSLNYLKNSTGTGIYLERTIYYLPQSTVSNDIIITSMRLLCTPTETP